MDWFILLFGLVYDLLLWDIFVFLSVGVSICIFDGDWIVNLEMLLSWMEIVWVIFLYLILLMVDVMVGVCKDD